MLHQTMLSNGVKFCDIDNATLRAERARRGYALGEALYKTTSHAGYTCGYEASLHFGDDLENSSGDHLVLFNKAGKGIVALKWTFVPIEVTINFLQRLPGADIQQTRSLLGTHPSELLMSEFIRRLVPLLHEFPAMPVKFDGSPYPRDSTALRDRFFGRNNWQLNPDRMRVAQIIGESLARLIKQQNRQQ